MKTAVRLFAFFFLSAYGAEGLSCYCREEMCDTVDLMKQRCKGGLVFDVCHCCKTCAKLEGERCGGLFGGFGKCDEGLVCHCSFPYGKGICRSKNEVIKTVTPPTEATVLPRKWQKILRTTEITESSFGSGDDGQETIFTAQPPNTESYFFEQLRTKQGETEQPTKTDYLYLEEELSTTQVETERPTEVIDLFSGSGDDNEKDDDSERTVTATHESVETETDEPFEEVLVTTQSQTEQPSEDIDIFSGDTSSGTDEPFEEVLVTTQSQTEQPIEDIDVFSGDTTIVTTQATQEPTEITELSYEDLKTTSTTRQPTSEKKSAGNKDTLIIF